MAVITPEVSAKVAARPYPETVRALAEKWGPIFGVEPGWVVSHAKVESSNNPKAYNARGNVYGLMQIKPVLAADIMRWLKSSHLNRDPRVAAVLKTSWKGQPEDLLNPELNIMFGTFNLGRLKKRFSTEDHDIVASAYNQGAGAVDNAITDGVFQPTAPMQKYLAKISEAREQGYA